MVTLDRRLVRPNAVIAFSDSGAPGMPAVLTHGAGLDHTMFDSLAAGLIRNGFRIITWDLRGHGESTLAPGARFAAKEALADLGALLDECEVRAAVLMGHSLGGNLVQAFARDHPTRVRGAIVLDATWNAGPLSRLERAALTLAAPILTLIPARWLPLLMARASASTPTAVARTEELFARMPKARFVDVWRATTAFVTPPPRPHRLGVPLALLRGEKDDTGNIATAMPRWAAAEGIDENVIPNAGHVVTWDAPEETEAAVMEILEVWRGAGVAQADDV